MAKTHDKSNAETETALVLILDDSKAKAMQKQLAEVAPPGEIKKLAERYGALTVAGVDDVGTYNAVIAGAKAAKDLRIAVEKRHAALKRPIIDVGRMLDGDLKKMVGDIEKIETHCNKEKSRIDNLAAAAKAEELRQRKERLVGAGYLFDGQDYVCGVYRIPGHLIESMTSDQEASAITKAAEELQRKQAEEKRLADEAEESRKKAQDLEAENENLRKQLAEAQGKTEPEPGLANVGVPVDEHERPTVFHAGDSSTAKHMHNVATTKSGVSDLQFEETPLGDTPKRDITRMPQQYFDGYEDAKLHVVALFMDGTKRTRAEFVEEIKKLRP